MNSLGDAARQRPEPRLSHALNGIGGALVTIALIVLIGGSVDNNAGTYIGSLAAFALGLFGRLRLDNEDIKAACVGAGITGLLAVCLVAISDLGMDPGPGLLITAAIHFLVWMAPGYRGRSIFLAFAALAMVFGASSLVGGQLLTNDRCSEIFWEDSGDDIPSECYESSPIDDVPGSIGDFIGTQGAVYLILGMALLIVVGMLDSRGLRGIATSLIPSSLLSIIIGLALVASTMADQTGALLAAATGVVLCIVGTRGARRATLWWGAAVATSGFLGLVWLMVKPGDANSSGLAVLIVAAALMVVPKLLGSFSKS